MTLGTPPVAIKPNARTSKRHKPRGRHHSRPEARRPAKPGPQPGSALPATRAAVSTTPRRGYGELRETAQLTRRPACRLGDSSRVSDPMGLNGRAIRPTTEHHGPLQVSINPPCSTFRLVNAPTSSYHERTGPANLAELPRQVIANRVPSVRAPIGTPNSAVRHRPAIWLQPLVSRIR